MRALFFLGAAATAVLLCLTTVKLSSAAEDVPGDKLKGFGCDFCDALVKSLETFLEGDHTEAEALAYMEQVYANLQGKSSNFGLGCLKLSEIF